MKNVKSGFTLLEVVLVIAIATLLFMSVVMGIGGRIATGRYETAANEIVDYFRDVYTATLNTENARTGTEGQRYYCTLYSATTYPEPNYYASPGDRLLFLSNDKRFTNDRESTSEQDTYPGRTDCAIYGKAIYFNGGKTAHVFDVVGNVVTNVKKKENDYVTDLKRLENATVLEQLEYARADIFAAIPYPVGSSTCNLSAAGDHTVYEPNWGALFKSANDKGSDFNGMVMVVRSPLSGNVSTFFYEHKGSSDDWDFFNKLNNEPISCGPYITSADSTSAVPEVEKKFSPVQLLLKQEEQEEEAPDDKPENTGFCIGSDDFYVALTGAKKYVEFIPGGQNASAVKLNETDIKDKDEKGYNPCL